MKLNPPLTTEEIDYNFEQLTKFCDKLETRLLLVFKFRTSGFFQWWRSFKNIHKIIIFSKWLKSFQKIHKEYLLPPPIEVICDKNGNYFIKDTMNKTKSKSLLICQEALKYKGCRYCPHAKPHKIIYQDGSDKCGIGYFCGVAKNNLWCIDSP